MRESKIVQPFMTAAVKELPGAHVWKINDRMTGGIPDVEVAWNGPTTKIEFKIIEPNETIHDVWEDGRQLIECARYEAATHRCWVAAYLPKMKQRSQDMTIIYKPSSLLHGKIPNPRRVWSLNEWRDGHMSLQELRAFGVVVCEGNTVTDALIALIKVTH